MVEGIFTDTKTGAYEQEVELQFRNQNQGSKPRQHYILDFRIYQTTRKKRNKKQTKTKERKDIKSKQMGKHAPTSYQIGKQNKLESIQRNLTNEITNGSMQRHLPGKQTCTKIKKKYRSLCSGCPFPPCTNVNFFF